MNPADALEYKCVLCVEEYESRETLHKHIKSIHKKTCNLCNKTYSKRRALISHLEQSHNYNDPKEEIICKICNKKYRIFGSLALIRHMNLKHTDMDRNLENICGICKKKYSNKDCLLRHVKQIHSHSDHQILCKVCNKKYTTKNYLISHMQKMHSKTGNDSTTAVNTSPKPIKPAVHQTCTVTSSSQFQEPIPMEQDEETLNDAVHPLRELKVPLLRLSESMISMPLPHESTSNEDTSLSPRSENVEDSESEINTSCATMTVEEYFNDSLDSKPENSESLQNVTSPSKNVKSPSKSNEDPELDPPDNSEEPMSEIKTTATTTNMEEYFNEPLDLDIKPFNIKLEYNNSESMQKEPRKEDPVLGPQENFEEPESNTTGRLTPVKPKMEEHKFDPSDIKTICRTYIKLENLASPQNVNLPKTEGDTNNVQEAPQTQSLKNLSSLKVETNLYNVPGGLQNVEQTHINVIPQQSQNFNNNNNGSLIKCAICCDESFDQTSALHQHIQNSHLGQTPYFCTICFVRFSQISKLQAHMPIHESNVTRPLMCNLCQESFMESANLKFHLFKRHLGSPYCCKICMFSFDKVRYLVKHIDRVHKGKNPEKQYYLACNICEGEYEHAQELKTHVNLHLGSPYACSACRTTFTTCKDLVTHTKMTHSYGCSLCKNEFASPILLEKHTYKMHVGPRPYSCGACLERFSDISVLEIHVSTHQMDLNF